MAVGPALAIAGNTALTILKSKWFWIALAVLLLLLILNKYKGEIRRYFQSSDIDIEPGETKKISNARKIELKAMAADLYSDIYDTPLSGHTHALYKDADDLSDTELQFLAKYYRKSLASGTYLFTDIKNEAFSIFLKTDLDYLVIENYMLSKNGKF